MLHHEIFMITRVAQQMSTTARFYFLQLTSGKHEYLFIDKKNNIINKNNSHYEPKKLFIHCLSINYSRFFSHGSNSLN